MSQEDTALRSLLIDISDRLSDSDRTRLCFQIGDDVPQRIRQPIAQDGRTPMDPLWEELINRQKISPDNVDYLIARFRVIGRIDLANRLGQYTTTRNLANSVGKSGASSNLFIRHEPTN